jgi:hypothetical protein
MYYPTVKRQMDMAVCMVFTIWKEQEFGSLLDIKEETELQMEDKKEA